MYLTVGVAFFLLLYFLYMCSAIRYDYRNSVMLIPYYSPISNTSSITLSESLSVTHWISIQLCHMGKQISKTSPGQERYPGLEGLRNYYSLSIVIWREGESLSKAYAMIYCRFSSKMGFYIVSEKWLRHYVDIRFARGSEAMPSRWLDFVCVCVCESKSVCKQTTILARIPPVVSSTQHIWLTDAQIWPNPLKCQVTVTSPNVV